MKRTFTLLFLASISLSVRAQQFDQIASKEKKVIYNGYEIQVKFDPRSRKSFAIVKRNGRTLINKHYGWRDEDTTRIALFPVLGGSAKQLIIEQYTGGAHCCGFYWIYDLGRTPRLLFSDESYHFESGNGLNLIDLDKDGRFELEQVILQFDYFHLSHSRSILPTIVFSYDEKLGGYRPANVRFRDYVLRGIDEDIAKAKKLQSSVTDSNSYLHEEYLSSVLNVVLNDLYTGKTKDAWSFFRTYYKLDDHREIEADLRKELRRSHIYRSL
jgi:hypothetical protein